MLVKYTPFFNIRRCSQKAWSSFLGFPCQMGRASLSLPMRIRSLHARGLVVSINRATPICILNSTDSLMGTLKKPKSKRDLQFACILCEEPWVLAGFRTFQLLRISWELGKSSAIMESQPDKDTGQLHGKGVSRANIGLVS